MLTKLAAGITAFWLAMLIIAICDRLVREIRRRMGK
jgi:hypothetical protein